MGFWSRPQSSPTRRLALRIHLWVGAAIGVYAGVIGVSGSALMFRSDLQAWAYPQVFAPSDADGTIAAPEVVIAAVKDRYPGAEVSGLDYPSPRRGTFLAYMTGGGASGTVFLHPSSGRVMGELPREDWIRRLQELHYNLLAGEIGETVSSAGAWCLMVLSLTGLVVWWPGPTQWRRGLLVDWRWGWKRVAFDLHRATGVWMFVCLLMWAATGIHFTTPGLARQIIGAVAPMGFLPLVERREPPPDREPLPLSVIVERAKREWPDAAMARVMLAAGPGDLVGVAIARERHGDWDWSDEATMWFDPFTGELRRTDAAWRAPSGEVAIRWLGLLHFGDFGGWPVKVLWAVSGLALPTLFVTGYLMWWSRVLRPRMSRLQG